MNYAKSLRDLYDKKKILIDEKRSIDFGLMSFKMLLEKRNAVFENTAKYIKSEFIVNSNYF